MYTERKELMQQESVIVKRYCKVRVKIQLLYNNKHIIIYNKYKFNYETEVVAAIAKVTATNIFVQVNQH